MKGKKILALVLACMMLLGCLGVSAAAAQPEGTGDVVIMATDRFSTSISANRTVYVGDSLSLAAGEVVTIEVRGSRPPEALYNLNGQTYTINGLFDTSIYTEYYFLPNADGKLYYNVTVTWPNQYNNVRGIRVECWNADTGNRVSKVSFEMQQNSDNSYGPTVSSGPRVISGLSNTSHYYFRFVKATDGIDATITGTIYA